jgi:hypothetical protein
MCVNKSQIVKKEIFFDFKSLRPDSCNPAKIDIFHKFNALRIIIHYYYFRNKKVSRNGAEKGAKDYSEKSKSNIKRDLQKSM